MPPLALFEFEAVEDGGAGDGAAAVAEAPAPEQDLTAGEDVAEDAPVEEPRSFSQEEFDAAMREREYALAEDLHAQYRAELARIQSGFQGVEQPGPEDYPGEFDPFDPESVAAKDQWLLDQVKAIVGESIRPVAQTFEEQRNAERVAHGEEVMRDMTSDAIAAVGGDLSEESQNLAVPLASMFWPEFAGKYGEDSPRSVEAAVYQAVNILHAVEQAAEKRGAEKQANAVSTLATAGTEPAAGTGAVAVPTEPLVALSPTELARKYTS